MEIVRSCAKEAVSDPLFVIIRTFCFFDYSKQTVAQT